MWMFSWFRNKKLSPPPEPKYPFVFDFIYDPEMIYPLNKFEQTKESVYSLIRLMDMSLGEAQEEIEFIVVCDDYTHYVIRTTQRKDNKKDTEFRATVLINKGCKMHRFYVRYKKQIMNSSYNSIYFGRGDTLTLSYKVSL